MPIQSVAIIVQTSVFNSDDGYIVPHICVRPFVSVLGEHVDFSISRDARSLGLSVYKLIQIQYRHHNISKLPSLSVQFLHGKKFLVAVISYNCHRLSVLLHIGTVVLCAIIWTVGNWTQVDDNYSAGFLLEGATDITGSAVMFHENASSNEATGITSGHGNESSILNLSVHHDYGDSTEDLQAAQGGA